MISYQWSIEIVNKRGIIEDVLYETELCKFEGRMKLLKRGQGLLCLMRIEVDRILWAYAEGAKLKCWLVDWSIPERFISEYVRFMNKKRETTIKRAERNLPVDNGGRVSLNDRVRGNTKIVVKGEEVEKIAVRINKKTILYLRKDLTAAEIDLIIQKYTKL